MGLWSGTQHTETPMIYYRIERVFQQQHQAQEAYPRMIYYRIESVERWVAVYTPDDPDDLL